MFTREDREVLIRDARIEMKKFPNLRFGQAIANVGSSYYPKSLNLFGTEFDCFYNDDRVELFLDKIEELYKG